MSKLDDLWHDKIRHEDETDDDLQAFKLDIRILVLEEFTQALKESQYLPEGITKFRERVEAW